MKNKLLLITMVFISTSLVSFQYGKQTLTNYTFPDDEKQQINIPENVLVILDRSCLPCHGADGSGKAKMKWNYGKMPEYSKTKLISKLVKITEEVDEGKMPPPKKVKKHPELKLSGEDKDLLISWAENAAEQLTGEGE